MNIALRDKVLKALNGSIERHPVAMQTLRKISEDIAEDIDELDNLIDQLTLDRVITRRAGYQNSAKVLSFWLAGKVDAFAQPSNPVRADLKPAQQVKPKTSIPKQPLQEQPMSKHNNVGSGQIITEAVLAHPGININELHRAVKKQLPDSTVKQVYNMTFYLHKHHKIERRGKGQAALMFPVPGKTCAAKPPAVKAMKAKNKKAAGQQACPMAQPPSPALPFEKTKNIAGRRLRFAFGIHEDGSVAIHKNNVSFELSASEANALACFLIPEL
ncbi:MAG: hypothetical protein A2143_08140 [Gallionellales bacterium RBG_16_57_15]|nr:MAG: hypothetical protein A2143_08140 [Gallionellales bacterium RBG_16_57_15]